ncbi:unnamed protein product [Spirodela intermedia]|uniref:Uncharacterized protein n=1 Tax=Spirodela intermedia TaxID=51605 RepID=A0A7I8IBJ0_SPIIN|nr:unnamed protein product [Spirodela intermedia]CAA6654940.1 unnamed protein product [Spirodela intermedia]
MYDGNPASKSKGALSMGVPGELAGLHAAWSRHGRLPWKSLLQPSIALARDGFRISPSLADSIQEKEALIRADPGLRSVFVLDGQLLRAGDTARNPALARTLAAVAADGPGPYGGAVGEALIRDVQDAGGLLTMDDLRSYNFTVTDALTADALGYTIVGMPPPSSGTVGLSMVRTTTDSPPPPLSLSDCDDFGRLRIAGVGGGRAGVHRLVESLKHMFAVRMNLGDPDFVNVTAYVSEMLSSSFAEKIRRRILDDATFGPNITCPGELPPPPRKRVAEMDDFSTPGDSDPDKLPPAPSNFIEPRKRPLSSMTPIIVLKFSQMRVGFFCRTVNLAGIIGASGGLNIISAVTQVFLNHFVLGMEALDAVRHPRVYHKLIPNVVKYENLTTTGGEHIERGHVLSPVGVATVCQLVVQDLRIPVDSRKEKNRGLGEGEGSPVFHGLLTAVSDPRKGGRPAGL